LHQLLFGHIEQEHVRQRAPGVGEHAVERLRLLDRPREAIEQEAAPRVGLAEARAHEADDDLVGHEVSGVHVALRCGTQLAAPGHGVAQDVPRRDVRDLVEPDDALRLRALSRPRGAEQHEVEPAALLAHLRAHPGPAANEVRLT
jgi:hypothetical protein